MFHSPFNSKADEYEQIEQKITNLLIGKEFLNARNYSDSICHAATKNPKIKPLQLFCIICNGNILQVEKLDPKNALQYFLKALEYLKMNPSINSRYYVNVYNKISSCYNLAYDYDNAIKYGKKALQKSKENGNHRMDYTLSSLSLNHLGKKDTVNAIFYQKTLIDLSLSKTANEIKLDRFDYYFLTSDLDSILFYGKQLLKLKNYYLNAEINSKLGNVLLSSGDTTSAIRYLQKCIEVSKMLPAYDLLSETAACLEKIYLSKNDLDSVKYYHHIIENASDSTFGVEDVRGIAELEKKYEKENYQNKLSSWDTFFVAKIIGVIFILLSVLYMIFKWKTRNEERIKKPLPDEVKKLQINEQTLKDIDLSMREFFAQKMYLDRNCSLSYITELLNIKNQRYLSEYIKIKYQKSFPIFINDLRFEHLKTLLRKTDDINSITIDKVAFDLGFGSTRNFYNYLLKKTGKTPKDFFNSFFDSENS